MERCALVGWRLSVIHKETESWLNAAMTATICVHLLCEEACRPKYAELMLPAVLCGIET